MADADVREALVKIIKRAGAALGRQAEQGTNVAFFEREWSAEEFQVHTGNEFAMHRWDMIGDDPLGDEFMSPLYVTESAIKTLNLLAVLDDAPTARARRAGLRDTRIVLRCPDQPDIAFTVDGNGDGELALAAKDEPLTGDAVVHTDTVNRVLTLWGRRSSARPISITGDPQLWPAIVAALWEDRPAWAPATPA